MSYLDPQTEAPQRPSTAELSEQHALGDDLQARILYLRSYLLMRALIGFVGLGLPPALVLGDWGLERGTLLAKGSLSAYFYSGMRDVFVGALCITGLFLLTYKVFEHNLDNLLSIVAGVAAIGVALFSTDRPEHSALPLTPLQDRLGEIPVAVVHYVSAGVFIACLGVISLFFGIREGKRADRPGTLSPTFWKRFHWTCSAGIGVAVVLIAVSKLTGWLDDYSLIIGETLAILSFGASWLMKGLELRVLLGPKAARRAMREEAAENALEPA